jgi:hypothetical protein
VSGQLHASAALPPDKSPRYPLDRRLGEPQGLSGHDGKVKLSPSGIEPWNPVHPARSLVAIPTELLRLSYNFFGCKYFKVTYKIVMKTKSVYTKVTEFSDINLLFYVHILYDLFMRKELECASFRVV